MQPFEKFIHQIQFANQMLGRELFHAPEDWLCAMIDFMPESESGLLQV